MSRNFIAISYSKDRKHYRSLKYYIYTYMYSSYINLVDCKKEVTGQKLFSVYCFNIAADRKTQIGAAIILYGFFFFFFVIAYLFVYLSYFPVSLWNNNSRAKNRRHKLSGHALCFFEHVWRTQYSARSYILLFQNS